MKRAILCLPIALAVSLILGTGQALAWQKDPDTTLGGITSGVTQLLAPDLSIGNLDTSIAGVGTDPVGIDSLTNPPPDPADSSPGTTYFVNNMPNDGDCPATTNTTIQEGVNASGPGDTVIVCPGTYREQVQISSAMHAGLKLESLVPQQAVIKWPATDTNSPHALVDIANGANNVTLRGFVISGPYPTGDGAYTYPLRHEGVLVENSFNAHIHHNHIMMIEDSLVLNRGDQDGDAVTIGQRFFPSQGLPGSARVDDNLIDSYQKNGIQAFNNNTILDADHNVITGPGTPAQPAAAPNGLEVLVGAAGTVDHNSISANHFANSPLSNGIIVDGAPAGSSNVNHNRVFDNDYGIETDTQSNLEISHNDVFQNTSDGITLCGAGAFGCNFATDIVVRANHIADNGGSGIFLTGADANLLKSNQVENNGPGGDQDGIHLDSSSNNNEIVTNQGQGNKPWDCEDESHGSGTDGTANTWQNDHGIPDPLTPTICT